MASRALSRPRLTRKSVYILLGILALLPVLAFAIGPLTSSSFDVRGPGGPALAFSAGVLSFFSPCVLPMVPIFIAQISGSSIENGRFTSDRTVTFTHAVAFVTGLSIIFIALGALAGLAGSYFLVDNRRELGELAGGLLVLMGVLLVPPRGRADPLKSALMLIGLTIVFFFLAEVGNLQDDRLRLGVLGVVMVIVWLRFAGYIQLSFFQRTFEVRGPSNRRVGYARSGFVGGAWALGWTPCIGPILTAILTIAGTSGSALQGTHLLAWYSVGLSIPFLITGLAISDANKFMKRMQPYTPVIEVISGVALIIAGVLLVSGRLTALNEYFGFAEFNQGL